VVDSNQTDSEGRKTSGNDPNVSLSDTPLPDLLNALVNDRGRVVSAEAPRAMNYRTMLAC